MRAEQIFEISFIVVSAAVGMTPLVVWVGDGRIGGGVVVMLLLVVRKCYRQWIGSPVGEFHVPLSERALPTASAAKKDNTTDRETKHQKQHHTTK